MLRRACRRLSWIIPTAFLTIVLLLSSVALPQAYAQLREATQLTFSPETFTIPSGQNITLTAKLTSDGQPLAGKQIIFTATLGSINPNIAETDENGVASAVYTAPKLSVRTSLTVTALFVGDLTYKASAATCQGVVEVEPPRVSISGASFAVPETLKDDVSSYRNAIPEDVLKLLPITLPSEAFILATPEDLEDLYLVLANQSDKGLAHVDGWKLPGNINLAGVSMSVIVAKSVTFGKEDAPATISEILANPDNYKFKLVEISANRRQVSILYDPDEPPYMEFPITVGYLVEKPVEPLDILSMILNRAGDFALKLDEQFIRSFLKAEDNERLWLFNFEYEYWYDAPTVTNGIIIPIDHPIFKLINQSMPVIGRFAGFEGEVVLYDVKTDITYEGVPSVTELKANSSKYLGKVVGITANCYGGYISIQEIIEHNTPCSEDYVYVEGVGCVNIVFDARLEGLIAWNELSLPPRPEELLPAAGVSSFHQDEQIVNVTGVFELIGEVVSTRQISDSLPEDVALIVYAASKVGEIDFERLAQQVKDEIKGIACKLYWVLQNIYPYWNFSHIGDLDIGGVPYPVWAASNSTITNFNFNGTAFWFNVTGREGTWGWCNLTIPAGLNRSNYVVFTDSAPLTVTVICNGTHYLLHFTYLHSERRITVTTEGEPPPPFVPELPLPWASALAVVAALALLAYERRRRKNKPRKIHDS